MRMKSRRTKRTATSSYSSSSSSEVEQEIIIRKGPWKAEEDEVLLKHVNKYGPRDWSSLLSKGLLQRTGKSCRLRWVNKLRPNLKNGCKFSADEERIVIELQAQLGNKWAKIATYLPGRTDNDVKNFWSSRQKRLARLLLNNQQQNLKSNSSKTSTNFTSLGPDFDPSVVESSSKAGSSTSLQYTAIPLAMIEPNNELDLSQNTSSVIPVNQQNNTECSILHLQDLPFLDPSSDLQLLPPIAHEELIANLDLDFTSANGAIVGDHDDDQALMQLSTEMASYLEPLEGTSFGNQQLDGEIKDGEGGARNDLVFDPIHLTPDRFFDDLPSDIFDQMEPIPSPPSDW